MTTVYSPMRKKKVAEDPRPSIDAAYELKRDPPASSDWSDVISLAMVACAALGIAVQSVGLSAAAFCVTLSLFINKRPNVTGLPQTFMSLAFAGFSIWAQYAGMHAGARSYWGAAATK
jgi:hypothetical protein